MRPSIYCLQKIEICRRRQRCYWQGTGGLRGHGVCPCTLNDDFDELLRYRNLTTLQGDSKGCFDKLT